MAKGAKQNQNKKKQDGSHEPECNHVLGLRVQISAIGKRSVFFYASCAHCRIEDAWWHKSIGFQDQLTQRHRRTEDCRIPVVQILHVCNRYVCCVSDAKFQVPVRAFCCESPCATPPSAVGCNDRSPSSPASTTASKAVSRHDAAMGSNDSERGLSNRFNMETSTWRALTTETDSHRSDEQVLCVIRCHIILIFSTELSQ